MSLQVVVGHGVRWPHLGIPMSVPLDLAGLESYRTSGDTLAARLALKKVLNWPWGIVAIIIQIHCVSIIYVDMYYVDMYICIYIYTSIFRHA